MSAPWIGIASDLTASEVIGLEPVEVPVYTPRYEAPPEAPQPNWEPAWEPAAPEPSPSRVHYPEPPFHQNPPNHWLGLLIVGLIVGGLLFSNFVSRKGEADSTSQNGVEQGPSWSAIETTPEVTAQSASLPAESSPKASNSRAGSTAKASASKKHRRDLPDDAKAQGEGSGVDSESAPADLDLRKYRDLAGKI